jgi:phage-related protein
MDVIILAVSYAIEYFNSTVQATIEAWPMGLKARYRALTLRMADHGANLGMPHTRAMGGGLFEIRVKSAEGIGRAFYCALVGRRIVILHGYLKKTDKTPAKELRTARNRMNEVLRHGA